MGGEKYYLVLSGRHNGQYEKNEILEKLAELFSISAEESKKLFESAPAKIKSGLSLQEADRYSKLISNKTGAKTEFFLDLDHEELISSMGQINLNPVSKDTKKTARQKFDKMAVLNTLNLFPKLFSLPYTEKIQSHKLIHYAFVHSKKIYISYLSALFITILLLIAVYPKFLKYISQSNFSLLTPTAAGLIFFFSILIFLPFIIKTKRFFELGYHYNKQNYKFSLKQKSITKPVFGVFDHNGAEIFTVIKDEISNTYICKHTDGKILLAASEKTDMEKSILSTASEIRNEIFDLSVFETINSVFDKIRSIFSKNKKNNEDEGKKIYIKNIKGEISGYVLKNKNSYLYMDENLNQDENIAPLLALFIIIAGY